MDIGSTLKKARAQRKLSLAEVEEATKIRLKYLQAMEDNNFSLLPPGMYGSAFLRTYARYLALDADELVAAYKEAAGMAQAPTDDDAPYTEVRPARARRGVWGVLAALVALGAAVGVFGHRSPPAPTAPSAPAPAASTRPAPTAPPAQVAAASGLNLVLRATNDYSWLRVTVDGTVAYEGFLYAGQEKDFQGTRDIDLRLGNAGSVRVLLNGQDYGYLGATGDVVQRSFTAGG